MDGHVSIERYTYIGFLTLRIQQTWLTLPRGDGPQEESELATDDRAMNRHRARRTRAPRARAIGCLTLVLPPACAPPWHLPATACQPLYSPPVCLDLYTSWPQVLDKVNVPSAGAPRCTSLILIRAGRYLPCLSLNSLVYLPRKLDFVWNYIKEN